MTLTVRPDGDFDHLLEVGFITQGRLGHYLGVEIYNGMSVHPEALLRAIEQAEGDPIPPFSLGPLQGTGAKVYVGDTSGDRFLDNLSKLRVIADEAARREVEVLFL